MLTQAGASRVFVFVERLDSTVIFPQPDGSTVTLSSGPMAFPTPYGMAQVCDLHAFNYRGASEGMGVLFEDVGVAARLRLGGQGVDWVVGEAVEVRESPGARYRSIGEIRLPSTSGRLVWVMAYGLGSAHPLYVQTPFGLGRVMAGRVEVNPTGRAGSDFDCQQPSFWVAPVIRRDDIVTDWARTDPPRYGSTNP